MVVVMSALPASMAYAGHPRRHHEPRNQVIATEQANVQLTQHQLLRKGGAYCGKRGGVAGGDRGRCHLLPRFAVAVKLLL